MSDVLLYQTNDNGEINVTNGVVEMSAGLRTAVYLSLFGGNEDDPGGSDTSKSWWGNIGETETYRSETQYLLNSIPATPNNLRRVEQAALRDLAWMTPDVANNIQVEARLTGLNKIEIRAIITAEGREEEFIYSENWKAAHELTNANN